MKLPLAIIVSIRLYLALTDLNYDYPDQHWQGPEVAHHIAFGRGVLTWEWLIDEPVRNPLYQQYLAIGYRLWPSLQAAPKLMQMLLAIVTDLFLFKIIQFYHPSSPKSSYFFALTNWYYLSTMSRTLINSFECCLTLAAYYFWLQRHRPPSDIYSRVLVAIGYIGRATSLLIWAIIWPYELMGRRKGWTKFIMRNLFTLVLMGGGSLGVGWAYYSRPVLTELNFLKYNFVERWSQLYGVTSFSFYFTHGILYTLGLSVAPFILSIYLILSGSVAALKRRIAYKWTDSTVPAHPLLQLLCFVSLFLFISSLSAHKEIRFIMCVFPFLLVITLQGLHFISKWKYFPFIFSLIIFSNLVMLASFTFIGKTDSVAMLRKINHDLKQDTSQQPVNILYFCEPHILPAYSILTNAKVSITILDTSPMAKLQGRDQVDFLQKDPQGLFNRMSENPLYIILEDSFCVYHNRLKVSYNFLLKEYSVVGHYKNSLIWQDLFLTPNGFTLLRRNQ